MKDKILQNIPNALTTVNLLVGLCVIVYLMRFDHPNKAVTAACLILFGGIIDFFDGYAARRLNVVSDFGKQLDSFADLITFAVAPISLVHAIFDLSLGIKLSTAFFVMAGIYRLARYNIGDFSKHFVGLPITAAGILLALYCAAFSFFGGALNANTGAALTSVFILILSLMMLCKLKFRRICK